MPLTSAARSRRAQRRGLEADFAGVYLGAAAFLALPSMMASRFISEVMSLTDLLRISTAFFAAVAAPQGLASAIGERTGFAAFLICFRVLEGLPFGLIEAASSTLIIRSFPVAEVAKAQSIFAVCRTSMIALSAPMGGLLYQTAGFTLPYTVVGLLGVSTVILLRVTSRGLVYRGSPTVSGSYYTALRVPAVLATVLYTFCSAAAVGILDLLWQPWLGVAPFRWEPLRLATVGASVTVVNLIGLPLVGMPINALLGEFPSLVIGCCLSPLGFLFVGSPPLLFPSLTPSPWTPYLAFVVPAIGTCISLLPVMGLPVRALVSAGMTQDEAAAPIGMIMSVTPYLGIGFGPVVGGLVLDHFGVATLGLGLCIVLVVANVLLCATSYPHLHAKSQAEALASSLATERPSS